MPTQPPPDVATGLARFLAANEVGRSTTVTSCRPIPGGYSRATHVAEVRWNDGSDERLILRSDPVEGSGPFDTDRDDEWALLQALHNVETLSIVAPRGYDGTGEHFGTKCIVMDFYDGGPLQHTFAEGDDLTRPREIFLQLAAAVHQTPLDSLPTRLPRPVSWEAYMDEITERFARLDRSFSAASPVLRYAAAWLVEHRPAPVALTLVHGDFQPSNILVSEHRPPVIIDWEYARIADPREDLGYHLMYPVPPSLYTTDTAAFLARYRELTGFSEAQVNEEIVEYFLLLGTVGFLEQMLVGVEDVVQGRGGGVMKTFTINPISLFYQLYLDICRPRSR